MVLNDEESKALSSEFEFQFEGEKIPVAVQIDTSAANYATYPLNPTNQEMECSLLSLESLSPEES